MANQTFLTNCFLIAMPGIQDPLFSHAVAYICEHNENGAIGIIINRPLNLFLSDVLSNLDIPNNNPETKQFPVMFGGPLYPERGFVIHRPTGSWNSSLLTMNDIAITTSRDILHAIANKNGPKEALISLGCAGWNAGQLEQELSNNLWLSAKANATILFDIAYNKRWEAAAALLGIDINMLSTDIGHA